MQHKRERCCTPPGSFPFWLEAWPGGRRFFRCVLARMLNRLEGAPAWDLVVMSLTELQPPRMSLEMSSVCEALLGMFPPSKSHGEGVAGYPPWAFKYPENARAADCSS